MRADGQRQDQRDEQPPRLAVVHRDVVVVRHVDRTRLLAGGEDDVVRRRFIEQGFGQHAAAGARARHAAGEADAAGRHLDEGGIAGAARVDGVAGLADVGPVPSLLRSMALISDTDHGKAPFH